MSATPNLITLFDWYFCRILEKTYEKQTAIMLTYEWYGHEGYL